MQKKIHNRAMQNFHLFIYEKVKINCNPIVPFSVFSVVGWCAPEGSGGTAIRLLTHMFPLYHFSPPICHLR